MAGSKGKGIHGQGPYTNRYMGKGTIATPSSSRDHNRVGKDKGIIHTDDDLTPHQLFILQYTLQAKGWGKCTGPFGTFGMDAGMMTSSCDHQISFDPRGNMVIEPPLPCPRCMPGQQQEHAVYEDVGQLAHETQPQRPGYPDWTYPHDIKGTKGNTLGKGMGQAPSLSSTATGDISKGKGHDLPSSTEASKGSSRSDSDH